MTRSNASRSTRSRFKRAGSALALTATVALGGIAMAAPANAATVGKSVGVETAAADSGHYWSAAWGAAFRGCKHNEPKTVSVYISSKIYYRGKNQQGQNTYYATWNCRT